MKKLIIMSLCLLFGMTSYSQSPEEMKAWKDNMTPNENHKILASVTGDWEAKVKMWMDPSQPPNESDATTKNEMIMGGLYQRSQHTGIMMGMPFNGESLSGYDNFKKIFFSTWIDNFGSGVLYMEGQYNSELKTLNLEGIMADPATGKEMKVKEVLTYSSEDTHKFEMFIVIGDQEIKNMEINYTRKK